jgi:hypothetical protein
MFEHNVLGNFLIDLFETHRFADAINLLAARKRVREDVGFEDHKNQACTINGINDASLGLEGHL